MRSLLGTVIWAVGFFLSSLSVCLAIPFLPEDFLLKDELLSLWQSPCMLFVVFPLLLLILVLCVWSLLIWLICILGYFSLGLSCLGRSGFLGLGDYFLSRFREVFNYYFLKYFLMVFLLVFFFWGSYDSNVGVFDILLEVCKVVLISFNSFFFFIYSCLFHLFLPFYLLPHLSYFLPPLFYCWFPPKCFWSF